MAGYLREDRALSWLQDAGCSSKYTQLNRFQKQLKSPPMPNLLGKAYILVCFFSESSPQEVTDWRPSDARRESQGCLLLSILLQQRPSGLHPGPLIALQSSAFKEGGCGRLAVIPHLTSIPRLWPQSFTSVGRTWITCATTRRPQRVFQKSSVRRDYWEKGSVSLPCNI